MKLRIEADKSPAYWEEVIAEIPEEDLAKPFPWFAARWFEPMYAHLQRRLKITPVESDESYEASEALLNARRGK